MEKDSTDSNSPSATAAEPQAATTTAATADQSIAPTTSVPPSTTQQQQHQPSTKVLDKKESSASTNSKPPTQAQPSLEQANDEIAQLLSAGKVTMEEVNALQNMMRQHVALQEKVTKLKSLLGRSAKAQREAKNELDGTQKKLEQALREIERLNQKVERLANRPTHMELLADFETNFDRALLSVGTHNQQSGGQDSASTQAAATATVTSSTLLEPPPESSNLVVDSMLMQELNESKNRTERLESLNSALLHRSSQLEQDYKEIQKERDLANSKLNQVQLELKMAQMEAEHSKIQVQDKMASLQEMQLEIDLVTKANVNAQVRAQKGEEAAKSIKTDKEHVQHLEAQVQALSEWAQASAESKRLAHERVHILERQVKIFQSHAKLDASTIAPDAPLLTPAASSTSLQREQHERLLFRQGNSLVIGAGDVGCDVIEMDQEDVTLHQDEMMLLRWKFDVTPADQSVEFSILKGKCQSSDSQRTAQCIIKDRLVMGGAGGETEYSILHKLDNTSSHNACTFVWSNKSSWIRPRTIKYEVEAIAVMD